jgi:hypothetical protein
MYNYLRLKIWKAESTILQFNNNGIERIRGAKPRLLFIAALENV